VLIKFWGVRGSIPVPGANTVVYGGNTTCIEIITSERHRIIIDAGTGIRELGNCMLKEEFGEGKGLAHILFTHSHWDHIQGFPFFAPAYIGKRSEDGTRIPGLCNEFNLYGSADVGDRLENIMRGQMDNRYFPVDLGYLSAIINFKTLIENKTEIGNTKITARRLLHPNGVLGFRIEDQDKILTIATDCEHPNNGTIDANLLELANNADVLIYDGQYTEQEYNPEKFNIKAQTKKGFGHSTPDEGVKMAQEAGVKKLVITHHDPLHTDKILSHMEEHTKSLFSNSIFAREGLCIEL